MTDVLASSSKSGFDFDSFSRNQHLGGKGYPVPKATSTGTTIAGVIYKDGIVLGADKRATEGPIVADKACAKIHYISDNIYCAGAGTAADTEFTTALISSNIALHQLHTGRKPRVVAALQMLKQRLFQHQGHIGAALVLGGYDDSGPNLYTVAPHGSTDKLPYVTMGSGSLAAMSVFESGWEKDMTREAAVNLVVAGISAGIWNDLGSGSNVDICVITKDSADYQLHYARLNDRGVKEQKYTFPKGVTGYTKEMIYDMVTKEDVLEVGKGAAAATAEGATTSAAPVAGAMDTT